MVSTSHLVKAVKARAAEAAGGAARLQIILMLAAVLALDAADKGAVSAVSGQLESAFRIGNTEIGLLIAIVSLVGAAATLPIGVLADRVRRQTILIIAVLTWAAAMVLSGTATSYAYLLGTRVALGAVTAAAWPCIASLTGDFFAGRERARVYGLILAGELIGIGIGFFISGEVSSFAGWRWSFYILALPAIVLAWILWRYLPEPERGRQSWVTAKEPASPEERGPRSDGGQAQGKASALEKVREQEVEPRPELTLHEDPTRRSWWWAIRYLLRLPTYRLLILASALAYYFFAGVRAFSMIYFTQHDQLARSTLSMLVFVIGLGALAGVIAGGRLSERLLERGKLDARIIVPAVALGLAVPFFGGGVWSRTAWLSTVLVTAGAGLLAAALAPISAARLDIIHPRLWGRAESGHVALRSALEGGAPLLFGAMSGWLGGGDEGLKWTFLIMLIPMLVASSLGWWMRRTYPRDVATAAASVEETAKTDQPR